MARRYIHSKSGNGCETGFPSEEFQPVMVGEGWKRAGCQPLASYGHVNAKRSLLIRVNGLVGTGNGHARTPSYRAESGHNPSPTPAAESNNLFS
jgi:hypothetical protein